MLSSSASSSCADCLEFTDSPSLSLSPTVLSLSSIFPARSFRAIMRKSLPTSQHWCVHE